MNANPNSLLKFILITLTVIVGPVSAQIYIASGPGNVIGKYDASSTAGAFAIDAVQDVSMNRGIYRVTLRFRPGPAERNKFYVQPVFSQEIESATWPLLTLVDGKPGFPRALPMPSEAARAYAASIGAAGAPTMEEFVNNTTNLGMVLSRGLGQHAEAAKAYHEADELCIRLVVPVLDAPTPPLPGELFGQGIPSGILKLAI